MMPNTIKLPDNVRAAFTFYYKTDQGIDVEVTAGGMPVLPADLASTEELASLRTEGVASFLGEKLRPMTAEEVAEYLRQEREEAEEEDDA